MSLELLLVCARERERDAVSALLRRLPSALAVPIVAAVLDEDGPLDSEQAEALARHAGHVAHVVADKSPIGRGGLHVPPRGYELYVERQRFVLARMSVGATPESWWSALLESAGDAYGSGALAAFLSSAEPSDIPGVAYFQRRGGAVVRSTDEAVQGLLASSVSPRTTRRKDWN